MKAIITVGGSASGKTTWAMQYAQTAMKHTMVISRDDIRREILELKHKRRLKPGELWAMWKFKDEDQVTTKVQEQVALAHRNGFDIIIADTNLIKKYRDLTIKRLTDLGYDIEIKEFPVSFEEAVKRDAGRADGVGPFVIWKQIKQWHTDHNTPYPQGDKKAILVDVDGTLAHMKDRGAFEWNRVGEDDIDPTIRDMVNGFYLQGYSVIVLSGRDGVCYEETKSWLRKHGIKFDDLLMRPAGDSRKDSIIKEELFAKHIAGRYDVKLVIDDRPQVVEQWHLMGLKVAALQSQYERF